MIHIVKGFGIVEETEIDVFSGIPLFYQWSTERWQFDLLILFFFFPNPVSQLAEYNDGNFWISVNNQQVLKFCVHFQTYGNTWENIYKKFKAVWQEKFW